jgi:hypothetical protein
VAKSVGNTGVEVEIRSSSPRDAHRTGLVHPGDRGFTWLVRGAVFGSLSILSPKISHHAPLGVVERRRFLPYAKLIADCDSGARWWGDIVRSNGAAIEKQSEPREEEMIVFIFRCLNFVTFVTAAGSASSSPGTVELQTGVFLPPILPTEFRERNVKPASGRARKKIQSCC